MGEWWQNFWDGLWTDLASAPDARQLGQIVARLLVAALLGGILGYERMQHHKAAGLRTHIMVALAAALFVLVPDQLGMLTADMSRVIQGLAAGVGFLGAGTILKQSDQGRVLGLTTAAGLYFTTAVGIAAGLGREVTAILGTLMAVAVMSLLPRLEWGHNNQDQESVDRTQPPAKSSSSGTHSGGDSEA